MTGFPARLTLTAWEHRLLPGRVWRSSYSPLSAQQGLVRDRQEQRLAG